MQFDRIRRREFITLLGGAAAAWPLAARAQHPAMPVIGFLDSVSPDKRRDALVAFHRGLNEIGYFENQNLAIEYRWAQSQLQRLPEMADELVQRKVAVIVVNNAAARAAQNASSTIPIVFVSGADPVRTGLVASLARPAGNMTGVSYVGGGDLIAKRLGLLHELIPNSATVAALLDPNYVEVEAELQQWEAAGRAIGRNTLVVRAASERDFDPAFSTIVKAGAPRY